MLPILYLWSWMWWKQDTEITLRLLSRVESCITILHINVMAEAVHPSSRRRRRPQQIYRLLSVYASVFGVAFAIMVDRRGTVWPHKCDCHTVTEIHASMIEFFASAWSQNAFRAISVQDAALPWTMRNSKIAARSTMVDTSACPSPPVFPPVSLDRLSVEVIIETLLQFKFTPSLASAVSALTQCILSTQSASTLQLLNNPDVNICLSLAADIVLEASISEVSNKKVSAGDESLCQLYQQFTAINAKRRPSKDVLVIKLYIVPPTTVPCVNWTTTTGVKQMISPN